MNQLNSLILEGNVCKEPEIKEINGERNLATFSIAVNRYYKKADGDFEQEVSYFDIEASGRLDNYNMATGVICDYKNTSVFKIKAGLQKEADGTLHGFPEWKMQGFIYAWLLQKNGLPATKCRFIALIKDHSKTEADRDISYPQSPVYVYEFPVTKEDLEETESFIMKKVFQYELFSSTEDDQIPECTEQECWAKKDVFAVKKEGRKIAVKLFDTQEEAESKIAELGKGHVAWKVIEAVEWVEKVYQFIENVKKNNSQKEEKAMRSLKLQRHCRKTCLLQLEIENTT